MPELNNLIIKNNTNLKFYARFESGAETTDSSGNSNTLTAISDPAGVVGVFGQGIDLDGGDGYSITDGATVKPTGSFSIGSWLKTSTTGAVQQIFASFSANTNYAGITLTISSTNKAQIFSAKNTGTVDGTDHKNITGNKTITDGVWHFIVGTWDGATLRIYVDGMHDGSVAWANAPAYAATNYVRVGCQSNSGANINFLTGSLDDVFLLNGTALSADQIKELYEGRYLGEGYPHGATTRTRELNTTILKNKTELKAYYRMEAGALTTDSGSGAVTLTNTNTVGETASGKFGYASDFSTTNSNKQLTSTNTLGIDGGANSISMWVKLNAEIGSGSWVFIKRGNNTTRTDTRIRYNYNAGTRRLEFGRNKYYVAVQQVDYTITLGTANWYHLVYTYDGSTISGYVNGTHIGSVAASGNGTTADDMTGLAIGSGYGNEYASILADDVAIFNTALTSSEIQELYYSDAGPVAGYHLNGNSTDFSGNNNHGTDTAITYSQANGKFNQGAGFGGSPSSISLPGSLPELTSNWTYSLWLKPAAIGVNYTLFSRWRNSTTNRQIYLGKDPGNTISASIPYIKTILTSTRTITDTAKHTYCVWTKNGNDWSIYINGVLDKTVTDATAQETSGGLIPFIGESSDGSDHLTGAIDEVQIYNIAKDARWVRQQYALGVGKFY